MSINMTNDQFRQLLTSITTGRKGSIAACTSRFDGTKDAKLVEAFLSAITIYQKIENIPEADILDALPLLLNDEAAVWWQGVKNEIFSWEEFQERLRHAFAPKKPAYLLYQEIVGEKQDTTITTENFVAHKRMLFTQLPTDQVHTEVQQLDMIFGQLNIRIREKIPRNTVSTFDDLLEAARGVEQLLTDIKKDSKAEANIGTQLLNKENKSSTTFKKLRCGFCHYKGHSTENCRKKRKQQEMFSAEKPTPNAKEIEAPSTSTPKFACYGCGAPGVVRSNCDNCSKKRERPPQSQNMGFCAVNVRTDARSRPVVFIEIDGINGPAYVDTCAKTSVASYTLYKKLLAKGHQFSTEVVYVTLADGVSKKQEVYVTIAPVTIENKTVTTTFMVLPESRDNRTLLGIGFIQKAHMILNLPQFTWQFVETDVTYELYDEDFVSFPEPQVPRLIKEMPPVKRSLPQTIASIATNSTNAKRRLQNEASLPTESAAGSQMPKYRLIPIDLSTSESSAKPIFDGYSPRMADYMMRDAEFNVQEAEVNLSAEELTLFPSENVMNVEIWAISLDGSIMSEEEKDKMEKLLEEYRDVFTSRGQPSLLGEHRITTMNDIPISMPPYRLSQKSKTALQQELNKMINDGIIEPCTSPWAAPVVLVPKPNGDIRVCVDYRRLNEVTVADVYPLPRIDDLLHAAKPTPYMTSLDLKAGYWQIKVRKEDEDKTAFITPFGIFKFKRMPFGLRNAPATFQRCIDRFRVSLSHIKLMAYLDDILIFSTTFENHLSDLKEVLQKMRDVNLTVNQEKCLFCRSSIKYLGHIITPEGLKTDPGKTSAIVDLPKPKNLKHLVSFLQMCSWYRRFIENFAAIAEPLTKLTKKNVTWTWDDEQETAYRKLKHHLTTAPILQQANENRPYVIKTDASNYALGAVLVQGEGEDERPIEYASRLLISAERNYSTTEREALAVVWALDKFRGYIEGVPVTVITDHQALKWLMNLKSPTGRLARWALLLQAFNVKVRYQPGKLNTVADALSRPACEENSNNCGICEITVTTDIPTRSVKEIRDEQLKDNFIKRIIEALENTNCDENAVYWSNKGYFMNNGMLYRLHPDSETDDGQLLVPEHEWANVLASYHDDPLAGHYGSEKTYQKIAKRYYWKGMRKYIESYTKKCLACQRFKPSNQKPAGLLQTTPMNKRFEVMAFDLFGPLPPTQDGKIWILIAEDLASRWVELFALQKATAENCAITLINEIFLRYGVPRRLISDNGTQFVSAVMQQVTFCLKIKHNFIPVYHPEANPVERRNRDLKTQLAILVSSKETTNWTDHLPAIRFAMNTSKCSSTNFTPAYLTFGRELRSPQDNEVDFRQIVISENVIPEITPKLRTLADTLIKAREVQEHKEEARKVIVDKGRQPHPNYKPGDLVLVASHAISKASQGYTAKFAPRRDGPYIIVKKHGTSSFQVASPSTPNIPVGVYHSSALSAFQTQGEGEKDVTTLPEPVQPLRKRGRPKKLISSQRGRGRGRK